MHHTIGGWKGQAICMLPDGEAERGEGAGGLGGGEELCLAWGDDSSLGVRRVLLWFQIPGEAEPALARLRKKLESPGSGGAMVAPAALAALEALDAVVAHLHSWDLKPHQVHCCHSCFLGDIAQDMKKTSDIRPWLKIVTQFSSEHRTGTSLMASALSTFSCRGKRTTSVCY